MISPLAEKYQHKVKTVEELIAILGPRPRDRKVIMCHGVFDVVHPGHLRHLVYSKSKADILVASLTADRHITKGIYRHIIDVGHGNEQSIALAGAPVPIPWDRSN